MNHFRTTAALTTTTVVAIVAIVLTGCSTDKKPDKPTTTTTAASSVSATRWASEVNSLCEKVTEQTLDLTPASGVTEENFSRYAQDLAGLIDEFTEDVSAVGQPEGLETEARDFVVVFEGSADILTDAVENDTSLDEVAKQLEAKNPLVDDLSDALDVPACQSGTTETGGSQATDDTDATDNKDFWAAAADTVCDDLNTKYEETFLGLQEDPVAWAPSLHEFTSVTYQAVVAIPGPEDDADINALIAQLGEVDRLAGEFARADRPADAGPRLSDAMDALNPLADAAGAPSCGGW